MASFLASLSCCLEEGGAEQEVAGSLEELSSLWLTRLHFSRISPEESSAGWERWILCLGSKYQSSSWAHARAKDPTLRVEFPLDRRLCNLDRPFPPSQYVLLMIFQGRSGAAARSKVPYAQPLPWLEAYERS